MLVKIPDCDASFDVRRCTAHIKFAIKVERVKQADRLVSAHKLIDDECDRLSIASYFDVVPLKIVEQAATFYQRLATLLDCGAQVYAQMDGAVA